MKPVQSSKFVSDLLMRVFSDPNHDLYMGGVPDHDDEEGDAVTIIAVVDVPAEWAKTQDWYRRVVANNMAVYPENYCDEPELLDYSVLDKDDVPTHLVRTMNASNTGWNMVVTIDGDTVTSWYLEDLEGNPPGWQGCYEYSGGYVGTVGVGELVNSDEAIAWVNALYSDYDDVWM